MRTVEAMRALGITIKELAKETLLVHGRAGKLTAPAAALNCGNSGTTMRLLAGVLAGQPFDSRLVGDQSLSRRPMKRVMDPLRRMGATINAEGDGDRPPLTIRGGQLHSIEYSMPISSAQVKSAILLGTLFAKGKTTVIEPRPSRDHTERMLDYYGIRLQRQGVAVSMVGTQTAGACNFTVPGDISSAAFWVVAAAAQPKSHLRVQEVGLNPTRTAVLTVLLRMGADVREVMGTANGCEPIGEIEIKGAELKATKIDGDEIPNLIDEIPVIAVAAALAVGKTVIANASELRVKETDRIAAIVTNLRAMGALVSETCDGLEIYGGTPLRGAKLSSFGDHRVAMAFAIAGLFADGETIIQNTECVATSYPRFYDTLHDIMRAPSAETAGGGFQCRQTWE